MKGVGGGVVTGVVVLGAVVVVAVVWQRVLASEPQQVAPAPCNHAATVVVPPMKVEDVLAQSTFVQRFPNLSAATASAE